MMSNLEPLDPPPRKAHLRRALRNLRRAYRTIFLLVVFVFGGWAALDMAQWSELSVNAHLRTIAFALIAVLAAVVWRVVENPLSRELRLARHGVAAQGEIVTVGNPRGRRGIVRITYRFRTAVGALVEGSCNLPRRFPAHTLEPGTVITVLYDPNKSRLHKPRLALDAVEFGELGKKKG